MSRSAVVFSTLVCLGALSAAHPIASAEPRRAPQAAQQPAGAAQSAEAPGLLIWKARVDASIRFVRVSFKSLSVGQIMSIRDIDATTGELRGESGGGGEEISQFKGLALDATLDDCSCRYVLVAKPIRGTPGAWKSQVELASNQSPPVVGIDEERGVGVVRGADGRLHAVNLRNGAGLWIAPAAKSLPASWNAPTVVGGLLYTIGADGALHALDTATGRESWAFTPGTFGGVSLPAIAGGDLYVAGRGALHVLEPASGHLRASVPLDHTFVLAPPVVAAGTVFLQVLAAEGAQPAAEYLYAVDAASRSVKGRFLLEPSVQDLKVLPAEWSATLTEEDGTVYVGSTGGQVFALRAGGRFEPVPQSAAVQATPAPAATAGPTPDSVAPPGHGPVSRNYAVVFNDERTRKVFSVRADGSGKKVVAEAGYVGPGSCSPTGRYVAVGGGPQLRIFDLSTGGSVPLDIKAAGGFQWFKQSDTLLVDAESGDSAPPATRQLAVFVFDAASGKSRRLAGVGAAESGVLSPDGRRLLFVLDEGGGPDLYASDIDGADRVRLSQSGNVLNSAFAWSPGGDSIVYQTAWMPKHGPQPTGAPPDRDAEYRNMLTREVFIVRPDGSGARVVAVALASLWAGPPYVPFSWHPDGRRLLLRTQLIRLEQCRPVLPAATQSPVMCAGTVELNPASNLVDTRFSPDGAEIVFTDSLPQGLFSVAALDLERGKRVIVPDAQGGNSLGFSLCRATSR